MGFRIFYKKDGQNLEAYTYSDYFGHIEDKKSTSGYTFQLSPGAMEWSSRKQPIVTLSTTEVRFVPAMICVCQVV